MRVIKKKASEHGVKGGTKWADGKKHEKVRMLTYRGDVGGGTREDGREGSGGRTAVGVGVTRSTLVTRRGHEGDTHCGDLQELSVDTSDVVLGVSARADLTLARLGPAPRHGDSEGRVGGVGEGGGEFVHPALDSPEPGGGVQSQGEGVLNIKGSLTIGELRSEGADVLVDDSLLADLRVPPLQVLRVVGGIILEFSNTDGGDLGATEGSGNAIHVTQDGGDDVAG